MRSGSVEARYTGASKSMDSEEQPKSREFKRVPLSGSRRRLVFERRLQTWLSLMGLPALLLCLVLIREHEVSWPLAVIWVVGLILVWALVVSLFLEQIVRPLQTLSNVVAGLREDDYSFRARGARRDDAMGDLALEINALAGMLQTQRAGALEAMALVERVIESMQSPMLAFDPDSRLQLLNAAAEKAFALKAATALGERAERLKLEHLLTTSDGDIVSLALHAGLQGEPQLNRWVVKRTYFRLSGVRHTLLMLSDVSAALREEERLAWERLIRVLGHEINNSLTPIKSIASSLRGRLPEAEAGGDFNRGLAIIEDRAESLNRFLQAYRRLMGLPVPKLAHVSLKELVERVVELETRLKVTIAGSPDVMVQIDADQLQQALINLVRNAVEAATSPDASGNGGPHVEVGWKKVANEAIIFIRDNGPGLTNESNLFVPFYTTKPGGTGVGLVLAQQIAEAHRGVVRLMNRIDGQGCVAELRLPRGWKSDE
jgi:two-component system, NtrC family, nitrogen regulation sensor histidine kinase NtrY